MNTVLTFIHSWLQDNYIWLAEATLTIIGTIFGIILWRVLCRRSIIWAGNTGTWLIKIIANALRTPILLLIIMQGGIHLIVSVLISNFFPSLYSSISGPFEIVRHAVVILVLFWSFFRIISELEKRYERKIIKIGSKDFTPGTMHAIFQSVRALLLLIVVLTALDALGISVSGLLAVGGFGSIIIGFAAKDTLSNYFSGLMIYTEQPFVVGDWIRHPDANIEGVVEKIGWRMTQIRTFDARPLYVPNALFLNSVVENPQRMNSRLIHESFGLRYEDMPHLPAVLEDIRQMLGDHPEIDQNQIKMANFDRYGDCSLDCFVYVLTITTDWSKYHHVKEDVLSKVAEIVKRHGCDFAFPTRTIHYQPTGETAKQPPPVS